MLIYALFRNHCKGICQGREKRENKKVKNHEKTFFIDFFFFSFARFHFGVLELQMKIPETQIVEFILHKYALSLLGEF